jgi:hypothetical protein
MAYLKIKKKKSQRNKQVGDIRGQVREPVKLIGKNNKPTAFLINL